MDSQVFLINYNNDTDSLNTEDDGNELKIIEYPQEEEQDQLMVVIPTREQRICNLLKRNKWELNQMFNNHARDSFSKKSWESIDEEKYNWYSDNNKSSPQGNRVARKIEHLWPCLLCQEVYKNYFYKNIKFQNKKCWYCGQSVSKKSYVVYKNKYILKTLSERDTWYKSRGTDQGNITCKFRNIVPLDKELGWNKVRLIKSRKVEGIKTWDYSWLFIKANKSWDCNMFQTKANSKNDGKNKIYNCTRLWKKRSMALKQQTLL